MALPLYTVTLFISAFILFLIQPMIGKLLLPKLGGTPQVWNTCMVFFQMVLLAGYAYSHTVSTRLKLRHQLLVHGVLLFLPFAILLPYPFNIGAWVPDLGSNPIPSTLGILFLTVAIPFLLVATSAPLLQKWFVYTGHPAAKDPYFLYGASNLGSMLALLAYPFLIEPFTTIKNDQLYEMTELGYRLSQPWIWTIGYGVLVIAVLGCALLVWKPSGIRLSNDVTVTPERVVTGSAETGITSQPRPRPAAAEPTTIPHARDEVTMGRRLRWVLLAAVPSSLMLGVTSFITTDLTPLPLFWLIPLTLYLASFIFVFARWPIVWTEEPHRYMLYAQPFAIALMLLVGYLFDVDHSTYLWPSVGCYVLGFFLTTMVCHGELAKDRPSPQYLTEFYLWMSVGGMLGGMFNGLFAPVIFFWGIVEFGVAVFAACLLRPELGDGVGPIDAFMNSLFSTAPEPAPLPKTKGSKKAVAPVRQPVATESASLSRTLDFVFPLAVLGLSFALWALFSDRLRQPNQRALGIFLIYGIPLIIACVFLFRPVRFALAIAAVMLVHWSISGRGQQILYQTRTYFGHLMVIERPEYRTIGDNKVEFVSRSLTHGTTHHGLSYLPPTNPKERGDPQKDLSRLATTYYHRLGPGGRVMEMPGFNWFPGPPNTYWSDLRMPCSLVGASLGSPLNTLVDLWSEPPYATVGLGTGTMASYGRPYQHVHYYEIDNEVRRFSLPWGDAYYTYNKLPRYDPGEVYFGYLYNAIARGCEVQVYMGDARLRMALPYENFHKSNDKNPPGGGPENFYRMMVVDAFSSDAIPAHLLTLEALEMYFKHLTPDGILCIHTSNRYVDLPKVAATIAEKKGWFFLRGNDLSPFGDQDQHSISEWIMVCRQAEPLVTLEGLVPEGYDEAVSKSGGARSYWNRNVDINPRYLWSDDYTNLWAVMGGRRRD